MVCVPFAVRRAAIYLAKCRFELKIFGHLWASSLDIAEGTLGRQMTLRSSY